MEITHFKVVPNEDHLIRGDNFVLILLDHCFQSVIRGFYCYVMVSQGVDEE